MKMNKYMLMVMGELKNNDFFYKQNNFLLYNIPNDGETLSDKTYLGKITAIWDLHVLGAITIHNKGEERVPGTNIYEFQILINQLAFNGIYEKCIREVTGLGLKDFEKQIQTKKQAPALLKKLNTFIAVNGIKGKKAEFLGLLSDFEPKLINDLRTQLKVKDIYDLKKRVLERIIGSGFLIETITSKSFSTSGTYQLVPSPLRKEEN